jgi:hypothetical protein
MPTQTLQEKVVETYEKIEQVFNTGSTGNPITTLEEFMSNVNPSNTLVKYIDTLFDEISHSPRSNNPVSAMDIKASLFMTLANIKKVLKGDIVNEVLHKDPIYLTDTPKDKYNFKPIYLMAMFVCGLISLNTGSFEQWMKLDKDIELDYIREFLSLFKYPTEIVVYSKSTNAVLSIESEPQSKIPDKLFLTSSIPDTAKNVVIMDSFPSYDPWKSLTTSCNNQDTITSDPVFWYIYVIQDPVSVEVVKCIGVRQPTKNRNYIFAYNIPKKEAFASTVEIWKKFVTEPYEAYANFLQNFLLLKDLKHAFINDDTAFISKGNYALPWLIYVHVLVMSVYGGNRNFYACKDATSADTTTTDAFVSGKTCLDYRALLDHVDKSPFPLTIKSGVMDENVMEHLANAHLELMRKNAAFTFNNGIIDENYDDTLNATCPVKYDWVFRDEKLSKCANWISKIEADISVMETRNIETLDPDLCVFRRIVHWMAKNHDQPDALKEIVRKFERTVNIGAQVDDNAHKHIAVDLKKRSVHKNILSPNSTLQDFLSSDPSWKKAMEIYFVGDWHPDNVFGKYLVFDDNKKIHEVRDIIQMKIDNDKPIFNLTEATTERAPSSASSHDGSGYNSDGSLRSMKSVGSIKGLKTSDSGTLPPVSRKMSLLDGIVETIIDADQRVEGGLGAILRELNDFATVDGMNKDERLKKMAALTAEIQQKHDELNKQKTILDKEIDGLRAELKRVQDEATKDKDALQAQMKTVRAEKDEADTKLAAALVKEAALQKEKNEIETNVQNLTGEKNTLAAQVATLTQELQDSQKKAIEDAETIRKLKEKVTDLEKEIVTLKQEITDNQEDKKKLLANDVSNQASLVTLAAKEKELADALEREKKLQLEKAQLEVQKKDLEKALQDDKGVMSNENIEKLRLMEDVRKLRIQIDQYELQLQVIIEKLKKGILEHDRQMTTRIWKIHDQVDGSIRKELTESELLVLLRKGDYIGFRDAVKRPVEQKEYKLPALFLIYESIGGTWRYFEKLDDTNQTNEFMAEKLMESLRLFQTIKKHDPHLLATYTNQYFRKFLETFQCLANDGTGEVIETF